MHFQRETYTNVICLSLLLATSLYFNVMLINTARHVREALQLHRSTASPLHLRPIEPYSFVGNDFPELLSIESRLVRMSVEESVHYSLADPEASDEWLWTAPLGDNHIRLGPDMRMFAIPMFHQLHCLRGIREAMENGLSSLHHAQQEHIHHCFNYIRQWTLCSADVTLEPGDFMSRNFTTERVGATHTCRDWEPAYTVVNDRWFEWKKFKQEHDALQKRTEEVTDI
ncbi:hypothetical protein SERLA73DRAFT_178504 [Serpula lacrymans var. lacrymans S7.3]|uniref:Uncharacterized protein n=2 Tax=Serpula lacrymans var. lacrymans TaxID=341189 RepID=F8PRS1_SERL3|nr:uncharacterized protein SERLADRAFT_462990 [Serpula lacrymans var. lacrymans S7.9]EGO00641.1 hypothetical protein SERLA73DRAFT_178504 [Serpula lacrymans var. lacrymans S7.3]EGO26196.1 hypothetical protein SERLADRAFT_462990 [Serpula lacrymans var. lacrymans S7.9]